LFSDGFMCHEMSEPAEGLLHFSLTCRKKRVWFYTASVESQFASER